MPSGWAAGISRVSEGKAAVRISRRTVRTVSKRRVGRGVFGESSVSPGPGTGPATSGLWVRSMAVTTEASASSVRAFPRRPKEMPWPSSRSAREAGASHAMGRCTEAVGTKRRRWRQRQVRFLAPFVPGSRRALMEATSTERISMSPSSWAG